jgi:TonB family protein
MKPQTTRPRAGKPSPGSSVLVLCLLAGASAHADWKDILEEPVSPGNVARLVAHSGEQEVQKYWIEALGDARPEVRAAAARVANVTGAGYLAAYLMKALQEETDAAAALEEIRAVASLVGPNADARLVEWAGRDSRFPWLVASALARARGVGARIHLDALREAGLEDAEVVEFFRLMGRTDPSSLAALGSVVIREADASSWAVILRTAREAEQDVGPIIAASLTSPSARVREATYWHLLLSPAPPDEAALGAAVEVSPEGARGEGTPGSRFAHELWRRRQGQPPRHSAEWTALLTDAASPEGLPFEVRRGEILALLSADETATLSVALTGNKDGLEDQGRRPSDRPTGGDASDLPWDAMRLPEHYPPGFVEDLVAVTKCRPRDGAYGAGLVGYRSDGRPRSVNLLNPDSHCPGLVSSLIVTALSAPRVPPEEKVLVVVPLAEGPLSCVGDSAPRRPRKDEAGTTPGRVGEGEIVEPRKTVHVAPEYPEAALQARVQGQVILEAILSPAGCVQQLTILRGIPLLDLAAFVAVSQWRYTPTLLDGEPVPVVMTVTVNFRMR